MERILTVLNSMLLRQFLLKRCLFKGNGFVLVERNRRDKFLGGIISDCEAILLDQVRICKFTAIAYGQLFVFLEWSKCVQDDITLVV